MKPFGLCILTIMLIAGCKTTSQKNVASSELQATELNAASGQDFQVITQIEFNGLRGGKKTLLGCLCLKETDAAWSPWKFHMIGAKGYRVNIGQAVGFDSCLTAREADDSCKGAI